MQEAPRLRVPLPIDNLHNNLRPFTHRLRPTRRIVHTTQITDRKPGADRKHLPPQLVVLSGSIGADHIQRRLARAVVHGGVAVHGRGLVEAPRDAAGAGGHVDDARGGVVGFLEQWGECFDHHVGAEGVGDEAVFELGADGGGVGEGGDGGVVDEDVEPGVEKGGCVSWDLIAWLGWMDRWSDGVRRDNTKLKPGCHVLSVLLFYGLCGFAD